ncbi:MAG: ABC transporter substrate-binding protein [Rhodospirillales bacterium]|nr:ABC transporter substrate-binding protein [Rhodospirillales bacterium]
MKYWKSCLAALLLLVATPFAASAQTVKVGLILSYSGQGASIGDLMDKAVKLYIKQHEKDLPAGVKLEIIRRDDTGPNPEVARRLAQELITREKVDFLAGLIYTPNAMAVASLATEAKVPTIVMNAGTSVIVRRSPYIARVSFTMWQSAYPLGKWAAQQSGVKRAYTAVTDYGPGHDSEAAFTKAFTESGGQMVGSVRMPLQNPDFIPFLQRVKDEKPDVLFVFVPAGKVATALMKAYNDLGLAQAGIKLIGQGDIVPDEELPNMGDAPTGIVTVHHYSASADRPQNKAFVAAWKKEYGADSTPSFYSVASWDGMAAIFHTIKAQNGKLDADKTMALLKGWQNPDSPRGPITIDKDTRDIIQNEYIRRLERVNGKLTNVEFETIPQVKDPWVQFNPPQ